MKRLFHLFGRSFWLGPAAMIALLGWGSVPVSATQPAAATFAISPKPTAIKNPSLGTSDMVADSKAIQSLAAHLKKVGAKMYGAYWCPHCKVQKDMFGSAIRTVPYIECDPKGENAKPDQCRAAKITAYPSWEIKGKMLMGVQSLEELATASGYKGPNQF